MDFMDNRKKKRNMSDEKKDSPIRGNEKGNKDHKQINIELDEATAQGTYSNLAIINHSVSEFVVDFVNIMPGAPKSKVRSRIILTPQHAKRLLNALGENIKRFENAHGEIRDYETPPIPMNFGPTGQA